MSYQNLKTNIIIALQSKGYDHDFILENKNIRCLQYNQLIPREGFEITEVHYCNEDVSGNPPTAIYAVQLNNHDIKGILMSKFQPYSAVVYPFMGKCYSKIKLLNELNRPEGSKNMHPEFEIPRIHDEY